jgi:hypothetical protein
MKERDTRRRADTLQAQRAQANTALVARVPELEATESPSEPAQAPAEDAVRDWATRQALQTTLVATSDLGIPPSFR